MPDWPARMGVDVAALYLGISETAFAEKVKRREYPQPIQEGGRKLWARVQLDRYVAAQFGINDNDGEGSGWGV